MQITYLKLLNFRNYERLELEFSKNTNLIYGNNGMGKTNLVEAIYVLSLTKSFRGSNDKILINNNKNLTKITGKIEDNINHDYQLIISEDGKRAKIDNNLCKKLSEYISRINVILFNPDDLKFIKESPSVRRDKINIDISSFDNDYLIMLSNYNKVLKQRNAYLKTMYINRTKSVEYLDILTSKLIEYGIKVFEKRKEFINSINKYISNIYESISGISNIRLEYISSYNDLLEKDIIKKYKKQLEKDMLFGTTQLGIHHDDFIFYLNDKKIKDYGSEGQQKNAIISYKLTLIKLFKDIKKKNAILILDDLFSELDNEKIDNILKLLDDNIQTFITTTNIDKVNKKIIDNSKIFEVNNNGIKEVIK